jgi:WD40 repeat protein
MHARFAVLLLCVVLWPVEHARSEPVPAEHSQASRAGKPLRTDSYGDPLPDGAISRLGSARFHYVGESPSLAFSPDGKTLVVGSWVANGMGISRDQARAIRFFAVPSGKLLAEFGTPGGMSIAALSLSPDGKTLASTADDDSVDFWDVTTRKLIHHARSGRRGRPTGLAWSPDGTTVAVCGGAIELWRARDGVRLRRFGKEEAWGSSIACSPDGRWLAMGEHDTRFIRVYAVATGTQAAVLEGGKTSQAVFTPDGRTLVSGDARGVIRLWKVDSWELTRTLRGPAQEIESLTIAPDGKSIAAALDNEIVLLWNLAEDRPRLLRGDSPVTYGVAFSPDGKLLASAGSGGKVQLWDVATGKERRAAEGHTSRIHALAYSPDGGILASSSYDHTIRLWDPAEGREVRHWGQPEPADMLVFSVDSKRLLSAKRYEPTMRVWEASTGKELLQFGHEGEGIQTVALSPEGRVISMSSERSLRRWDAATGKELGAVSPGLKDDDRMQLSPDGRLLAVARDFSTVHLIDTATGGCQRVLRGGEPDCRTATIALSDRWLAAGCSCKTLHLCDLTTGQELWKLKPACHADCLAFSFTGRLLASGGEDTIQVFEAASGAEIARFQYEQREIRCIAFAPDGCSVAAGYPDTSILVWDITAGASSAPKREWRLTRLEREELGRDLVGPDARKAYRAVWRLLTVPDQAIAIVDELLRPAGIPAERSEAWIADLGSGKFAVREKAHRALETLGPAAESALKNALRGEVSPESRRRIKLLLENLQPQVRRIRESRALEVLEYARSPEARRLLQELARGPADAFLSAEARAALTRLARKP